MRLRASVADALAPGTGHLAPKGEEGPMRTIVRLGLDEQGRHVAVCQTGDCTWRSPGHVVKAGAVEEARYHRATHRREGPT